MELLLALLIGFAMTAPRWAAHYTRFGGACLLVWAWLFWLAVLHDFGRDNDVRRG